MKDEKIACWCLEWHWERRRKERGLKQGEESHTSCHMTRLTLLLSRIKMNKGRIGSSHQSGANRVVSRSQAPSPESICLSVLFHISSCQAQAQALEAIINANNQTATMPNIFRVAGTTTQNQNKPVMLITEQRISPIWGVSSSCCIRWSS